MYCEECRIKSKLLDFFIEGLLVMGHPVDSCTSNGECFNYALYILSQWVFQKKVILQMVSVAKWKVSNIQSYTAKNKQTKKQEK